MKMSITTPEADAATIRPRTFTLDLSDDDIKRLYEKTGAAGTTPAEVLTGFICDLITGTQTRGSDERDLAQQYFERCCYDIFDRDFLQWALYEYRLDELTDLLDKLENIENDLAYYEEHPEETADDPDGVQAVKDAKADTEKELAEIYKEYQDAPRTSGQSYSDGVNAIRRYLAEVQAMTERGQLDE